MKNYIKKIVQIGIFAKENLIKNRTRTISVITPLVLVIMVASCFTVIKGGLMRDALLPGDSLPHITGQSVIANRVQKTQKDIIHKILDIPHVVKVVPRIWGYAPVRMKDRDGALTIVGLDLDQKDLQDANLIIREGSFLEKGGNVTDCIIGDVVAAVQGVGPGDTFVLTDTFQNDMTFTVKGVFVPSVQIYASSLILTSIEGAKKYFGLKEDEITDLEIYLDDPTYSEEVAKQISSSLKNFRVFTRDALQELSRKSYGETTGVFKMVWVVLLITSVLVAIAQGSSIVIDLKQEIGILRAIGWGVGDIVMLKILESLFIVVASVLLGWLFTVIYLLIDAPGIKHYFIGWSTLCPSFPLPLYFQKESLFKLFSIVLIPSIFISILAAFHVTRQAPDESIRKM